MRRFFVSSLILLGANAVPAHAEQVSPTPLSASIDAAACASCDDQMKAVLSHPRRAADLVRDVYRHPGQTLAFFQVKPGMTVVDYMPSGGWYTRVLAPYLGKEGRYIGLNPNPGDNAQLASYFGGLAEKFPAAAQKWDLEGAPIAAYNSNGLPADLDGTVDRVVMVRSMHTLFRNGMLETELGAVKRLLKADGLLGVVQHRAKADAPDAYADGNKGYLRQKDVIAQVEAQGFELVGSSELNANTKDPADHPAGVWELAPNLRTKREELRPIGESDRMTLLFRKRP